MDEVPDSLLAPDEPAPVTVQNENGPSPFLIVADHAGNSMPRALGRLGVPETECERHIAWDIGIAAVSRLVADALEATLVQQNYSRLVIDCNRTPGSEGSIPEISELTPIPGNIGLSEGRKAARVREIFRPYHNQIKTELDRRRQAGRPVALIAMHGFTPVFMEVARPWHAGVLYNRDPRFARLLMALLELEEGLVVGDNEPYSVTDASDYTIPVHGERRGLHHIAIEAADSKNNRAGDITRRVIFWRAHAWPLLSSGQLPFMPSHTPFLELGNTEICSNRGPRLRRLKWLKQRVPGWGLFEYYRQTNEQNGVPTEQMVTSAAKCL